MDLALNNLQRLICHKTHQTKPNQNSFFWINLIDSKYSFFISNNSIKHLLFVYTQMIDQTILYLTLQSCLSFNYAQFKCQIFLFDPLIRAYQVLQFWIRVDLGVMAMKGYSTFQKAPGIEPSPSDYLV